MATARLFAVQTVSMPFKRAVWLQPDQTREAKRLYEFQCPLSGQFGCNGWDTRRATVLDVGFNAL